jgi:hypothetical protein
MPESILDYLKTRGTCVTKRLNSKAEFTSQAEFNLVDNHREMINASICQAATNIRKRLHQSSPSELTACIFTGAHGNDLSLPLLFKYISKITLVGDDPLGREKGIAAQGLIANDRLELMGNLDVTGIRNQLAELCQEVNRHRADLTALIQEARTANWKPLPKQVDFNASVCFLSQLVMDIVESVGEHHEQFVMLIQAVRLRHLQLMLEQLRPGGIGLFVLDFVSSETLPALPSLTGEELERTLRAAIENNNYFHGLNPQIILQLFEQDLHHQLSGFQFCKPWVWKTAEQAYAVTAVMFQKKSN